MPDSAIEDKAKKKPAPLSEQGVTPAPTDSKPRYLKKPLDVRILNYERVEEDQFATRITLAVGTAMGVDKPMTGYVIGLNSSRFDIEWADASSSKAIVRHHPDVVRQRKLAKVGA